MDGFNGTIFAYGQTGSGKTYCMLGSEDNKGVIPNMITELFQNIEAKQQSGAQCIVTISYLEIYNDVIKDLLNPSDTILKIREHPKMGIYVEGLAEIVSTSGDDVMRLLQQGNSVRAVATTQMNERSSRSHSCFIIKIAQQREEILSETKNRKRVQKLDAKVNLVDLAGSERVAKSGASGQLLKEGAAINKSLSALGNVINALAEGSKYVPYRDSKLTRLLQESLGGNSCTVMLATISPADYNYSETRSTLQYANRAKRIKNETKRNENINDTIIRELRAELDMLRAQLAAGSTGEIRDDEDEDKEKLEEIIANLKKAQENTFDEKVRLSKLYEEQRQRSLENENRIKEMMETLNEQNLELRRKYGKLKAQHEKLTKKFQIEKNRYSELKESLKRDMEAYEIKIAEEAAIVSGSPNEAEERRIKQEEMHDLLNEIEEKRKLLLYQRNQLNEKKQVLKDIALEVSGVKEEISAVDNVNFSVNLATSTESESIRKENEALLKSLDEHKVQEKTRLQSKDDEITRLQNALDKEREKYNIEKVRHAKELKKTEEYHVSMFQQATEAFDEALNDLEMENFHLRQQLFFATRDIEALLSHQGGSNIHK
eukprot:g528.t1